MCCKHKDEYLKMPQRLAGNASFQNALHSASRDKRRRMGRVQVFGGSMSLPQKQPCHEHSVQGKPGNQVQLELQAAYISCIHGDALRVAGPGCHVFDTPPPGAPQGIVQRTPAPHHALSKAMTQSQGALVLRHETAS